MSEEGKVIMVDGGKGGVGKSFVCMATADRLKRTGVRVRLVEADNSNSDVAKCYAGVLDTECIDLETGNGWIEFLDLVHAHPEEAIVVNNRAANQAGLQNYAKMARDGLRELGRGLTVLWVMNAQRDSVELLRDFLDLLPGTEVHAVRNLYYGRDSDFSEYDQSKTRQILEGQGYRSLWMPKLASYVTDQMYNERLAIDAVGKVSFGLKQEVNRWRSVVDSEISLGRVLA
jgi:hypothetical protein